MQALRKQKLRPAFLQRTTSPMSVTDELCPQTIPPGSSAGQNCGSVIPLPPAWALAHALAGSIVVQGRGGLYGAHAEQVAARVHAQHEQQEPEDVQPYQDVYSIPACMGCCQAAHRPEGEKPSWLNWQVQLRCRTCSHMYTLADHIGQVHWGRGAPLGPAPLPTVAVHLREEGEEDVAGDPAVLGDPLHADKRCLNMATKSFEGQCVSAPLERWLWSGPQSLSGVIMNTVALPEPCAWQKRYNMQQPSTLQFLCSRIAATCCSRPSAARGAANQHIPYFCHAQDRHYGGQAEPLACKVPPNAVSAQPHPTPSHRCPILAPAPRPTHTPQAKPPLPLRTPTT